MKLNEKVLTALMALATLGSACLVVVGAVRGDVDMVTRHLMTLALLLVSGSAVLSNITIRELRASVRALEAEKTGRVSS